MSHLLFLDESGHDRRDSPYEVIAGVALEDRDIWNLICEVQDAEVHFFGRRITPGTMELKARSLLKRKTFRLAGQMEAMPAEERAGLARRCLEKGDSARTTRNPGSGTTRAELTALAQSKIAFAEAILELCGRYRAKAFASIVDCEAPKPTGDFLRKDYAYLFERYYSFLDQKAVDGMGFVVFDELDRAQAHILVEQMGYYFRETAKGRMRASLIIPEPFFVHSHLTTAIQLADLVAYIVAWGVRIGAMDRPARPELQSMAEKVCELRFRAWREDGGNNHALWSFAVIDDLRPREERAGGGPK